MRRPPHPGRAATIRNITTRRGTCRIARHVSCMLVPMINRDAAVNRRRVLLAVGGMSLISAAVPGLARPRPDGPRPVHRGGTNHGPARGEGARRDGARRGSARGSAPRSPGAQARPPDQPLYYIPDAGQAIALTID